MVTPIADLGSDLTGAGQPSGSDTGASCVLVGPSGEVDAGETASAGDTIDLHVDVVRDRLIAVGLNGPCARDVLT